MESACYKTDKIFLQALMIFTRKSPGYLPSHNIIGNYWVHIYKTPVCLHDVVSPAYKDKIRRKMNLNNENSKLYAF
jgi:hypothetical protein